MSATYAFREGGGPCTTNRLTGEHEHHYPDIVATAPDFGMPRPAHAMTDSAEKARAAHRRLYRTTVAGALVTEHERPIVPYTGGIPAAAKRIGALAKRKGWTVKLYENLTGCALQGVRGDEGFRAYWVRGKTNGATWHERRPRYVLESDERPVKMNKRDHVGLKGYRSTGMGPTRLRLVAGPHGMALNVTDLEKRIEES